MKILYNVCIVRNFESLNYSKDYYGGFSIDIQHDKLKAYELLKSFDTEEEALKYLEGIFEKEGKHSQDNEYSITKNISIVLNDR